MHSLSKSAALKQLLIFALPIIFGHLGLMLIGTGDMLIAGRYSRESLAAIGLAISISNPVMMLCLGLLFAISPLLAQKRGHGEDIAPYFWTVVTFGAVVGIAGSVLTLLSIYLLPLFNYSENLTRLIREYLIITSSSILGVSVYQAVKEFFQAQEKTIAANLVALVAAAINIWFNYAFVYGKFGFPEMKEAGLAWASLSIRTLMAIALILTAIQAWRVPRKIKPGFFRDTFKLGYPISIAIFFEVLAFCSVTLFVGKFEEVQTAANNIVLNIASLAFMVPLSIGAAVSVKAGHAFGERNAENIIVFSKVSLLTSLLYTFSMASLFYFFPLPILTLFTEDHLVLGWGIKLLLLVSCFQLFDGAQVTLAGILRGLGITRAPSLAIFVGYWVIGIPLGYYLGFFAGFEAQGFWIGLAVSLALVALMLGEILRRRIKALRSQGL